MPFPPCKKCDPDGLKILPTLYAALPASVSAVLPGGISGQKVIENPLSSGHHYGLLILRDGYIYLIYADGPRGKNYLEAYRVIRNGTVIPLPLPAPIILLPEPACSRTGHELRASTITIQKPSECGEIFIAFAEHRWSDETLNVYLTDVPKRRERMQSFFPKAWIEGTPYEHAA
ncbi:MAG: T6SS effector BTH_I2691 family protein, partial [Rhodanobacter sp.]